MVNGNDYLEIEQDNFETIEEDYIHSCIIGLEEIVVPDEYKDRWIAKYLEWRGE